MNITRTPLRISFVGGGTDLPGYYENYGNGAVLSSTIAKYVTVMVNARFDGKIRLNLPGRCEEVESRSQVSHSIVHAVLERLDIQSGVEITSVSDVAGGSGLGSSSAFTTGLYFALAKMLFYDLSPSQLARESYIAERLSGSLAGKQDHYSAAFGGTRLYQFSGDRVIISREKVPLGDVVLFDTNVRRSADSIIAEYDFKGCSAMLSESAQHACLAARGDVSLSSAVKCGWEAKRSLNPTVCSAQLLSSLDYAANMSGASAYKVLGAGGGGFVIFIGGNADILLESVPSSFTHIPFIFTSEGSREVFCEFDY
jgi:D-glycero-alpha-D-manno-heptose-7-phosphate kinase